MDGFNEKWIQLRDSVREEGPNRERITRDFFDYYQRILLKQAEILFNKYKITNSAFSPKGIVADTIADFYRRLRKDSTSLKINNEDDLGGYLYTILRNKVYKNRPNRDEGKDFYGHEANIVRDFDDDYRSNESFERNSTAVGLPEYFQKIYQAGNRFCYDLLKAIIIEEYKYDDLLGKGIYASYSKDALKKHKERCLKGLRSWFRKTNFN